MERTGGEPDVIGYDKTTGEYIFCDCAAESPSGRRSLCYDRAGQDSRKEHAPSNNAVDVVEQSLAISDLVGCLFTTTVPNPIMPEGHFEECCVFEDYGFNTIPTGQ